jgi:hypothetical protein
MEPGDESLVRSWSGVVFGACIVGFPVLFGVMDLRTCVMASLAGAVPSLVFSRPLSEPSSRPLAKIAFVIFALGFLGTGRILGGLAMFTYVGGWLFVLSVLRLVTGWRDPYGPPPQPEWSPDPASRPLVWIALVLPLLVLVGLIVLGIAMERGAFR